MRGRRGRDHERGIRGREPEGGGGGGRDHERGEKRTRA